MDFDALQAMSRALFKNKLVVPIAVAIAAVAEPDQDFTATEIREQLGGKAESNQIREVLEARLEICGAVEELPYPGQPHPRTWRRLESPFWEFISSWVRDRAG